MRGAPFASLCSTSRTLTVGQNRHVGQGQTKLVVKTKQKELRPQPEVGDGQDEGASESTTPRSSPRPCSGAKTPQKTPTYLKKRLSSEPGQAMALHICTKGGIFDLSAVSACSPGRLPEEVFTLLISGRELGGWGTEAGAEGLSLCAFPNCDSANLFGSSSKTPRTPRPEGAGRGVLRPSAPSGGLLPLWVPLPHGPVGLGPSSDSGRVRAPWL